MFDYLETKATIDDIRFFVASDFALNVRFYDLIVLSLLAIPEETKKEVSGNFFDEMGAGDMNKTHIQLLQKTLSFFNLNDKQKLISMLDIAGLTGYNLLLYYALSREYYFQSIGALAITELADPNQYQKFMTGCKRLKIFGSWCDYYCDHIDIDALHGDGWIDNVIVPVVKKFPHSKAKIIQGVLNRLDSSDFYWSELHSKMKLKSYAI